MNLAGAWCLHSLPITHFHNVSKLTARNFYVPPFLPVSPEEEQEYIEPDYEEGLEPEYEEGLEEELEYIEPDNDCWCFQRIGINLSILSF